MVTEENAMLGSYVEGANKIKNKNVNGYTVYVCHMRNGDRSKFDAVLSL